MPEHGTLTRYANYKCRCDECKAANAAYQRAHRMGPCIDCGQPAWVRDRWHEGRCRRCEVDRRRKARGGTRRPLPEPG